MIAESFCSLMDHCFQLVYTEVMIDLIEDTIDKAIVLKDETISVSSSKFNPYKAVNKVSFQQFISGIVSKVYFYQKKTPQLSLYKLNRNTFKGNNIKIFTSLHWELFLKERFYSFKKENFVL